MTYTDSGLRVPNDWTPQAMANGMEWSWLRRGRGDQFNNLYRRRWGLSGILWYVGALVAAIHPPAYIRHGKPMTRRADTLAAVAILALALLWASNAHALSDAPQPPPWWDVIGWIIYRR